MQDVLEWLYSIGGGGGGGLDPPPASPDQRDHRGKNEIGKIWLGHFGMPLVSGRETGAQ